MMFETGQDQKTTPFPLKFTPAYLSISLAIFRLRAWSLKLICCSGTGGRHVPVCLVGLEFYVLSQDERLKYTNLSRDIKLIEGEDGFSKNIWTPNIFIENERESTLMKTTRDSTFVRIHDTGTVHYHYRLKTVVLCDFKLERFPHDTQNCTIRMESCKDS